jgi:hypothetical protein
LFNDLLDRASMFDDGAQTMAIAIPAPDAQSGTFQRTIRCGYDDLNRLTSAQESGSTTNSFSYAYDRSGNRTDGGNTSDAANQVSGWTYDAAGALTNDSVTTDVRPGAVDLAGAQCHPRDWDRQGDCRSRRRL